MTQRQQWGIVLGVVMLLAAALGAGVHFLGDELFPVSVGSKAPPIAGVTIDGTHRERSLDDYKGKVVLLNVWATWCEPCRVEMPSIEKGSRSRSGSRSCSASFAGCRSASTRSTFAAATGS